MSTATATAPLGHAALDTPLHIGHVGLIVRDLDRMSAFYRNVLGLEALSGGTGTAVFGAGGVPFLTLTHRADAKPDDTRTAGLFHTAFLMPTRADLGRWLTHTAKTGVELTGASDHTVSEAIYLDDPEGNGVEVYRDRPPEEWEWQDGMVHMGLERLDLRDVAAEAHGLPYAAAPAGLRIGHVHLRVGDLKTAEDFYTRAVGLQTTRRRDDGGVFLSSGGYHHHIATNIWRSRGAGPRDTAMAGLDYVTFAATDQRTMDGIAQRLTAFGAPSSDAKDIIEVNDPWGTQLRFALAPKTA